jgi:hypothetical protein
LRKIYEKEESLLGVLHPSLVLFHNGGRNVTRSKGDELESMYICNKCGFLTDDEDEACIHAFDEHGLEVENCFSFEENLSINDQPEPEENIDESEGLTEEEVRGAVVLGNYENIEDETLRKQVLSVALGQSTNHDKKFQEPIKISDVPEKYFKRFAEKINCGACPECAVHYSQLGLNLSREAEEDLKEELVLPHISKEHPKTWEMIKDLYNIPKKAKLPHQQVTWTPNPENCSAELTKEELSQKIASDPDLRSKLLQRWKELKTTKDRSQ